MINYYGWISWDINWKLLIIVSNRIFIRCKNLNLQGTKEGPYIRHIQMDWCFETFSFQNSILQLWPTWKFVTKETFTRVSNSKSRQVPLQICTKSANSNNWKRTEAAIWHVIIYFEEKKSYHVSNLSWNFCLF